MALSLPSGADQARFPIHGAPSCRQRRRRTAAPRWRAGRRWERSMSLRSRCGRSQEDAAKAAHRQIDRRGSALAAAAPPRPANCTANRRLMGGEWASAGRQLQCPATRAARAPGAAVWSRAEGSESEGRLRKGERRGQLQPRLIYATAASEVE